MKTIVKITTALLLLSATVIAQEKLDFPLIDAAIANLREGKQLTNEEIEKCEAEKTKFMNAIEE